MPNKNEARNRCDESFKRAALEYIEKTGSDIAAPTAGLNLPAVCSPKNLPGMAILKAENEALRKEVLQLQEQWDSLKVTLGILSTAADTQEMV